MTQQLNSAPDIRRHRVMNRTIWENSFSENIMLNFPENAKKHCPRNDGNCPKSEARLIFTFF